MFNFTINSEKTHTIEPGLTSTLASRLSQLDFLCEEFGPKRVTLRFDPIVHYRDKLNGPIKNNLEDFHYIMGRASKCGVKKVVFSFCIPFRKTLANFRKYNLQLITLGHNQQKDVLDELMDIASKFGIQMQACSSIELINYKNKNGACVGRSACIDGKLISSLVKLRSKRKDPGQRTECNCVKSRDIGSYELECPHGCTYCYANPKFITTKRVGKTLIDYNRRGERKGRGIY
uniref:DNA repair photolyase n=1 Tax=Pithovirus LCDPAC01 TaxID=2506600 RepID=A0A481YN27_9VIRU|nr:MAG: protein of unknown function DUF1848 [Pithovirus LCDPAC01]